MTAVAPPTVILTSNSERDLGDALKRRCLHLHIGFPEQKLEERIVESRVPGISQTLRKQMVGFIHEVRTLDLKKLPSVSETIDWARVLVLLQASELDHEIVKDTLNVLLKYEADIEAATAAGLDLHRQGWRGKTSSAEADAREPASLLSCGARSRGPGLARRKHRCDARGRRCRLCRPRHPARHVSADARQDPGRKARARRLLRPVLQPA